MKYIKKINCIFLIIVMLLVNFIVPINNNVEAKTLRDLKTELSEAKKKYNNTQQEKMLTEAEMEKKSNEINSISIEIENIKVEIKNLEEEIEELNVEILEKQKQIKQIINYYQISNGESAYLEYAFAAADFTDFIYRMAISEQLSDYNDRLIDDYNAKIKENEQKKKDLNAKTISLNNRQVDLEKELVSLGSQLSKITDVGVSVQEEIKALEELVNTYERDLKCDLDEDIDSCAAGKLLSGTQFYKPVTSGYISSDTGPRTYWLNGRWVSDFHYGIDFAGTGYKAPVYSAANGKVAMILRETNCGGNMLFIIHTINGKNYTTGYFHLATVKVNIGDAVTANTIVGEVGGTSREYWDSCSTGAHLHFQVASGHITGSSIGYYTRFASKYVSPREILTLPQEGGWFSNRY